jgi:3-oxoacyl-[acyl-carrier-protein] synthase II
MGLVCCNGADPEQFFRNCRAGKSGLSALKHEDVPVAGIVSYEQNIPDSESKKNIFCREAIKQAFLRPKDFSLQNCGLYLACDAGSSDQIYLLSANEANWQDKNFCHSALRNWSPASTAEFIRGQIALPGHNRIYSSQCISSMQAVGEAFESLRYSREGFALCGGVETFQYVSAYTFVLLNIYTRQKEVANACRPFDMERSGIVIGEGAAFVQLENETMLKKTGSKPICEIISYAVNNNTYHVTNQKADGGGYAECMAACLHKAGLTPGDIDLVVAHGTGTRQNDSSECAALRRIFRDSYPWLQSIKSYIGHTLYMSGIANIIAAALQIEKNFLLPTLYLKNIDPECEFRHVPEAGCQFPVNRVLTNASAFGGFNSAMLLQKPCLQQ